MATTDTEERTCRYMTKRGVCGHPDTEHIDGRCLSCYAGPSRGGADFPPDYKHDFESVESDTGHPEDALDAVETVLIAHQRQSPSHCLCGWSKLGHSHPRHQAEALLAALAVRDQSTESTRCATCGGRIGPREPGLFPFDEALWGHTDPPVGGGRWYKHEAVPVAAGRGAEEDAPAVTIDELARVQGLTGPTPDYVALATALFPTPESVAEFDAHEGELVDARDASYLDVMLAEREMARVQHSALRDAVASIIAEYDDPDALLELRDAIRQLRAALAESPSTTGALLKEGS